MNPSKTTNLRQKAEEQLKQKSPKTSLQLSETEILKLNHELQVHQIELEIQNEELKLTNEKLIRAKEKADNNAQKYTELYDFAPMSYFTLSTEGEIIGLNFGGAKMLGKEHQNLLGNRFGFFVSEDTKPIFNNFLNRVFTSKTKESCELNLSIGGNSEMYVKLSGIVNNNGKQCFATIIDITLLKSAELVLQLHESEIQYKNLVENLPDAMAIVQDGKVVFANSECLILLGAGNVEELLGKPFLEFVHTDSRPLVIEKMEKIAAEETVIPLIEEKYVRLDDNEIDVEVKAMSAFFAQKPAVIKIIRNITQRKLAEKDLIKAKEKAEESDRLKTSFINNISHEIRTPINGILGFAPFIIQPDITMEEKEEYLGILSSSSIRLMNTINDIMDISLIISGNMELHPQPIDISSLLTKVFEQYQEPSKKKNLGFKMQFPDNAYNYILHTDGEMLQKVVSHLVDNSVKFTKEGSVTLGFELINNEIEIFVKDTGVGIEKDAQEHIYKSFIQEDNSLTRGHEGSGLGLSIAKGMMQLLGGEIRLESTKNVGTTVFLLFRI